MKHFNFPVIIEHDSEGYAAFCPQLQGCYAQGNTYEEATENIKDAIKLHLEDRTADEEEVDHRDSVSVSMVEVAL